MKTKILGILLSVSLLIGIVTIATHISSVSAAPQLYIDPSLVEKAPSDYCTYFNVSVMIADVTDLFGFDIKITWDSSLLTFHKLYNYTLNTIWTSGWFDIWPPSTGAGWMKYVAVGLTPSTFSGSGELFILEFHVEEGCNFAKETPIHFEAVKLSDSSWTEITAVLVDGLYKMSATIPDLEIEVHDPDPTKPFEYCKIFEVEIYVTHICAKLKDYYLVILYDTELLKFLDVDYWGVLGDPSDGASYVNTTGRIEVQDIGGLVWSGDRGLLFALTFHVEFDDRIEHIWRTDPTYPQELKAHVWLEETSAELSFLEGVITYPGIIMSLPLEITIHLIQGDVACDGDVDIFDLRTVAAYYDQTGPAKYDLKTDGIIDIFDLVVVATNFGYADP